MIKDHQSSMNKNVINTYPEMLGFRDIKCSKLLKRYTAYRSYTGKYSIFLVVLIEQRNKKNSILKHSDGLLRIFHTDDSYNLMYN